MVKKNKKIKIKGYQFGPLFIGRKGRFIFMENRSTKEEFKKFLKNAMKYHRQLPKIIKSKAEKLEKIISQFNPLDLIANLAFLNLFTDPETYKEYSFKGKQSYVEYLSLLCLKEKYKERDRSKIPGKEIEEIQKLIEKIFMDALWYYGTEYINSENLQPPTAIETLRFETIARSLMVRNPGYYHHLEDLLRGLFNIRTIQDWMIKNLGFDIEVGIKCSNNIIRLMENRISERKKKAIREKKKILKELNNYRKNGKVKNKKYKEIVKKLVKFDSRTQLNQIQALLVAWIFFALGDTFSFNVDDLASGTKCSIKEIENFLKLFSINFGEIKKGFYIPEPVHELQTRPIIKHPKGYFCPVPGLLLWSLKPRIEKIMKNDKSFWNKYEKLRHRYTLQKGLEFFNNIFQSKVQIFSNLKYNNNELDGLVIFDRNCLLVEVKGGELTPRTKKGFFDRLKKDVKSLIKKSHNQALKAKNFIENSDNPIFKIDKKKILFPKDKIDSYFLVTIFLDPLDPFTTNLSLLTNAGLLSKQDLPWAVSLLDFRVISEIIEFPTQFTHYLRRRLRVNDIEKIKAHDELDFFMNYLKEGLYYEEGIENFNFFQLATYTTELDDYYAYITGQRKTKAEKPKQFMPKLFRELIYEIESKNGDGYTKVIETLLEMDGKSRNKFIELFKKQKLRTKGDGRLHDFTITVGNNQIGYTWFVARDDNLEKIFEKLTLYCSLKKYQLKATRWVGLISLIKYPGLIHGWIFNNQPWQFNLELEKNY